MRRAQHVFGVITCITFNFLLDKHCATQFHIPSHYQTREMKFFTVLFVCLSVVSVSAVERKTVSGNDCIDRGIIFWPYICCSPCTHSPHSLSSFSCPRFDADSSKRSLVFSSSKISRAKALVMTSSRYGGASFREMMPQPVSVRL